MYYNELIDKVIANTVADFGELTSRERAVARFAAIESLAVATRFSDETPANSPRPVENSPLNAQKKPGFGPEQTR